MSEPINKDGLAPLSEEERKRVRADFEKAYREHGWDVIDYDRTNGEMTWEWAFYYYTRVID